jgi:hypothetical protein
MINNSSVSNLVEEYSDLIEKADSCLQDTSGYIDSETVSERLVEDADWSQDAAAHLVRLSSDYGIFMLRNALALAIATKCEDGKLGF